MAEVTKLAQVLLYESDGQVRLSVNLRDDVSKSQNAKLLHLLAEQIVTAAAELDQEAQLESEAK